jgi:hypothetical protein
VIFTKFLYQGRSFDVSDITIVTIHEKVVRKLRKLGKAGKNLVFGYPKQLKHFYLSTDFVQILYNSSPYDVPYNDSQTTWKRSQTVKKSVKKTWENYVSRYP